MLQKLRSYFILSLLLGLFIISGNPCKAENTSNFIFGFIDNGNFIEFGALYFDATPYLSKNVDALISLKYQNTTAYGRKYIQIMPNEMKNYFSFSIDQIFSVYANAEFLGEYKIKSIVIVMDDNQINEAYEVYAQLSGMKYVAIETPFIAKISVPDEKPTYNIFKENKLDELEKIKVEKILSKKLSDSKINIVKNQFPKVNIEQLECKMDYQCFKIKDKQMKKENILINAIWKYDRKYFKIDTDFYITNMFIISDEKLFEIEPIKTSFNRSLKIPKILWGISFDNDINSTIKWIINYEVWECSINKIIELNGEKYKELFERRLCDVYSEG